MSKESEKKELEEKKAKAREVNQSRNNERVQLMEQIADTSETERELAESPQEEPVKEPEKEEPSEEPVEEPKEEPKEEAVPGDEKEVDGVKYYLTIVNGQDRWQTLKQLREAAQKVESADEYLRSAAEAARSAAAGAPSQKDEPPSLGEDEIADLLRKQALGDDEATRQLAKLYVRPSKVTPDVLQALDQRLSFRTELAELEAKSRDLLDDPNLGLLFRAKLGQLKQTAPNTKLADAYKGIDKELRTAFPGFKNSKLTEKLERKRTLPQIQSAATRQTTEAEEEGEEDPSTVIERMAKARGATPHTYSPRKQ